MQQKAPHPRRKTQIGIKRPKKRALNDHKAEAQYYDGSELEILRRYSDCSADGRISKKTRWDVGVECKSPCEKIMGFAATGLGFGYVDM